MRVPRVTKEICSYLKASRPPKTRMQMHVFSLQGGASRCDLEYVRCAMNNGDARNISMRLLPTSHVYDSYVYRPLVKDPYRMCIACSYAYASVSSVAPCLSFVGRSYLTCGATWLKSLVYASNSFVGCSASVSSVAVPQFRRWPRGFAHASNKRTGSLAVARVDCSASTSGASSSSSLTLSSCVS